MKAAEARVLLTGASGGIGQAMAVELVRRRRAVMGVGRARAQPAQPWVRADLTACRPHRARVAPGRRPRLAPNVVVQAAGLPGFGALGTSAGDMAAVLQPTCWRRCC
jgi:NAD(P)-dependent dehydrogenase (short-subunit alcohol dehydrogenase family)